LGADVTLIERAELGGTCLNRGCIPTKALVRSARLFQDIQKAPEFGIEVDNPKAALSKMTARNDRIIQKLVSGIQSLLKQRRVRYVAGSATLNSPSRISVESADGTELVEVDKVILATGSSSVELPDVPTDGGRVITTDQALTLTKLPARLLIIGAGIIAAEFASIYSALGSDVTILARSKFMRKDDPRVVAQLSRYLKKNGVQIIEGSTVSSLVKDDREVEVTFSDDQVEVYSTVLVAVGRSANTGSAGIRDMGINQEHDTITVDSFMRTSLEGVYAVGDLVGEPMLAHVAAAEAKVAASNCVGISEEMDYSVVPSCVFTIPEYATVGLSPRAAKEKGVTAKVAKFSLGALGRALGDGNEDGFAQIVTDEQTGLIIGCQIIGEHASDVIHEAALAISQRMTASELGRLIHQHPTYSESIMEASEGIDGISIHSFD